MAGYRHLITVLVAAATAFKSFAGGSGLNVAVVVNQDSTNSIQLGNYYMLTRHVPPQNLLRIYWSGANTEWALSDYTNTLLNPFLAMLSSRQLTNQIDYVVLSMDIPYRINAGTNYYNSTTSALFYGFKNDPNYNPYVACDLAAGSSNLYSGSEAIFRSNAPSSGATNFWIVSMITSSDLYSAESVVLQGESSDATFSTNTVWLSKSTETAYNIRYTEFDNTVFDTRLRGNYSVARTNLASPSLAPLISGYANGSYGFGIASPPFFTPGAMADNLCSFGGQIFENSGESTALLFITAGASGSYGTIIEPCNYPQKFPDTQDYFYQSRGFSLGECYYMSLTNPYQGAVYGEPLAAPFARPGSGAWTALTSNSILSGTTNLALLFTAADTNHPLQQVDLFLDGEWLKTVTNIAPQSGNVLNVTLNGYPASYTVPSGATVQSVASGLESVLAGSTYSSNTKVSPHLHGDRVELQSTAAYTKTGSQVTLSVSSTNPTGPLTTFIRAGPAYPSNFLDSTALGFRSCLVGGTLSASSTLALSVTKTNNAIVSVTITNNGNSTFAGLAQQLVTAVNNTASLQGLDGVYGDDVEADGNAALFNFYARGAGYAAAQVKTSVSGSAGITITPAGSGTSTDNVNDLYPRNHLYVTAGATNLSLSVPFATTNYSDGWHELDAVAYEGSSVRTQTRATQTIVIQNNSLSATLTPSLVGSNNAMAASLLLTVTANTGNISSIQLFSTGGLMATSSNQSSAVFTVNLTNLWAGTHPFYAIVTDNSGHTYRTQTQTLALTASSYGGQTYIGVDYPFPLQLTGNGPQFQWPATAGRSYNILSTTDLTQPFQTRATVIATNSIGNWLETNDNAVQQFYGVSVAP
jgi:uncharacterized protein (TIGR03790 family)